MRFRSVAARVLLVTLLAGASQAGAQEPAATFKSGVDLVTVSAVVRDKDGRLVPSLQVQDFQLLDSGEPRTIAHFRAEETPVSIAVLFDVSGSMDVGDKKLDAREAAGQLLSWLRPGTDEIALFTFDSSLHEITPFSTDASRARAALETIRPFGVTSLRDAIAATAQRVVERGRPRRAVLVLTDGVDTASTLSTEEVSGIASSIDVPVYIVAVVSPLDHPGAKTAVGNADELDIAGSLADLARWTGGALKVVSAPAHASLAVRQIVNELRHQYLIVFEPGATPGWHPLEVRMRGKGLTVRARSGYFAGQNRPVS